MDARLAERFGKPIAAVFAEEGEEAFRAAEAELCRELAAEQQLVISTGGGALVNESSRTALAETGMLVCLTASEGEILRRLGRATDRPLLAGEEEEKRKRIRTLLGVRRAAYGAIPYQIDTDGSTPEQVVERILAAAESHGEAPGHAAAAGAHAGRYVRPVPGRRHPGLRRQAADQPGAETRACGDRHQRDDPHPCRDAGRRLAACRL